MEKTHIDELPTPARVHELSPGAAGVEETVHAGELGRDAEAHTAPARFYGKYRGIVIDADATTMRIRASVPSVLAEEQSAWCLPCVPYAGPQVGFVMLPSVGSAVWIEFEAGNPDFPIWSGCFWHAGEVPAAAGVAVQSIVTRGGALVFNDDGGSVTLNDAHGNTVVLDAAGVTAVSAAGSGAGSVAVSAAGVSINDGALQVI